VVTTQGPQPALEKTEEGVKKILSLPIYPELEKEKVEYVCASVREFFRRG
jgi:dTDP-4-amino-4,6-dideoxygalactose transaminase